MSSGPRFLSVSLCVLLVAACSQAPPPQASAPPQAPAKAPSPTPAPAAAAASPAPRPPTDRDKAINSLLGPGKPKAGPPEDDDEESGKPEKKTEVIVDPATGRRVMKVPKEPSLMVRDGNLYSAIVPSGAGIPILRQDEEYYYVAAPEELSAEEIARRRAKKEAADAAMTTILELPKDEGEAITPKISKKKIRFENLSAGLPKNGIWRENFALVDIDGDGRPEIVSPPPRLSGQGLRIFKWTGERWKSVTPDLENPEGLLIGYGGIAAGDLDGDGRADIVWGGHGSGAWAGWNLGNMKFRLSTNGLPGAISSRAVAIGDLDGDGKGDLLILSDIPEGGQNPRPSAQSSGYIEGYDVRAFLNKGDRFVELLSGLDDKPCYGYALALETRPIDKGAPFFVTSCNYAMGVNLIYEFDRKGMKFRNVSYPLVELYSVGMGVAVGTYRGHPAAFSSYFKNRPAGGLPDPTGDGVSVYYRDGETWKRKRVLKRLGIDRGISQGIGVGDLDGDGLDDIVVADRVTNKIRVFFQTPEGEYEELDPSLEPSFVNFPTAIRIGDVDGDGRPDIVLMLQYLTASETKEGGLRFFRNLPGK